MTDMSPTTANRRQDRQQKKGRWACPKYLRLYEKYNLTGVSKTGQRNGLRVEERGEETRMSEHMAVGAAC